MTNQEAITIIGNLEDKDILYNPCDVQDAKTMAIKALEQEPSGDFISRQAVDDAIYDYSRSCDVNYAQIMEYIDKLPPVNPQERTGHWRPVYQGDEIIDYRCSECEFGSTFGKSTYRMNYCPNCGCRMVEPQERSDKE